MNVTACQHPLYNKDDPDLFPSDLFTDQTIKNIWDDICHQISMALIYDGDPEPITVYRVCLKLIAKHATAKVET